MSAAEGPDMKDLFRRLGEAQDAALARPGPARFPVRRQGHRWALGAGALGAGALVVAAALLLVSRRAPPEVSDGATAIAETAPAVARETLAAGDSELPLRFDDGSTAIFRPGASGRVLARTANGAELELLAGQLEADIVHAARTRWVFRAGPFAVHVTGTRFEVDWAPHAGRLVVSMREGSVIVDGAVLGAGVPLRAGQRLSVALAASGKAEVRTEAMDLPVAKVQAAPNAPTPTTVARVQATTRAARGAGPERRWLTLAERGAHAEAWRVARELGLPALRRELDAPPLLALADVARYAGAHAEAREIFVALVTRFPGHRLAGDAVFSLGRLAFEAGDPAGAARWFSRYQQTWPSGALAAEALGRLLESTAAVGDGPAAQAAARAYLERTPEGPYGPLARRIIGQGGRR